MDKLELYGIWGTPLQWFSSCLSNRKQFVHVNGSNSTLLDVTCGVPQGSVIGPLLFLVFINDLPHTSSKLTFYLFADDTNICCVSGDLTVLEKPVYKELKQVKCWLDINKLSRNIDKTSFVIFHSVHKALPFQIVTKFGKSRTKQTKCVKFLRLLVDEHLSWKFRLSELSKNLQELVEIFLS